MQTHNNLIQGSDEWHAYRARHFNASDAPAMMGASPYKSRTELLHERATGIQREVNSITQKLFDDGHRFEALARVRAEEIVGEDLYPQVGSLGELSASFDGLTMDESIAWEHKSLNDEIRAAQSANDIGLHYRIQMEQQLLVSGAEKCLFLASTWTDAGELIEETHFWYQPDEKLREKIIAGWGQFKADLAAYVPPAAVAEAVGRTPESLPALRIEVTGMVTASNLDQFKGHALAVFHGINRDLKTDQDFADAGKTVKWCGDIEERLAAAKQHALSQTESIDALFRAIDEISAEARATRLELDRLVEARKKQIRIDIQQEAKVKADEHIAALNQRLGKPYMPSVAHDFAGAMKGKKTVSSLRDAVDTELAAFKIESNAIADKIQFNLTTLDELASEHMFLFADAQQIVLKASDDFTALVKLRIAEHKEAEEKRLADERVRIAEEERIKAEAKVEVATSERIPTSGNCALPMQIQPSASKRVSIINAPKNVEMVTIPKSEYDQLLKDSEWLACLEAAGVDNWSGYDEARALRKEAA